MKTLLLFLLGVALAMRAVAQESFTLEWSAIASGGGASTEPGEFTLTGSSVGQIAAGNASTEPAEFDVTGGHWTFEFEPSLPELHLAMQLDGGIVTLTWDADGPPVSLESSADLHLWAPVDPQPAAPFFQETSAKRKFYRLVPAP